jgi:hypothetical protein
MIYSKILKTIISIILCTYSQADEKQLFFGRTFSDALFWTHFYGRTFLDALFWTHFFGRIFSDYYKKLLICINKFIYLKKVDTK